MIDLDDLDQLALNDSQWLFERAAGWRERLPVGCSEWEVDAPWLDRCRPDRPTADNPAKQLALRCYDRVPCVWSDARLFPLAQQWQGRMLHYAEAAALSMDLAGLARDWSMARFPRFWPNAVIFVHLVDGQESAADRALAEKLQILLQRRSFQTSEVALPGTGAAAVRFQGEELGEWVALYLAALYGVDPADRVPWQFLDLV